jgi:hypothetical protein
MADLAGKLHLASLRGRLGNELATFDSSGRLRPSPAFELLKATIAATEAKLVVLDNVAHLFTGNENDRAQVTAFINLLYSLCLDFDTTVLLIAHPNKAGDSYSGSTAWLNAVRSQIIISRPEDSVDPDERILSLGKANYSRPGETLSFRWHDFALVTDADIPANKRAEMDTMIQATADNELFLTCLTERNRQKRPVSEHPSANYAPKQFASMPESKGIGQQRLTAAMDRLFRIGRIERGFVCRDTERRRDQHGLIEVQQAQQTTASNRAQTPATDRTEPDAQTATNTPPYIIIRGAALGSAAPHPDEQDIVWDSDGEQA